MSQILESNKSKPIILVVDDSVENLQLLTSILKEDYTIKVAKNGIKAVELAQKDPIPNLILMDIIMPEMDGYEACTRLKENSETNKIPVIFLTSLHETDDEKKGFKCGGADFINKPINPDIVKARIKTHIDLQSERKKTESLLKVLLPDIVIGDLMNKGVHKPQIQHDVSILFSDFVGFSKIATNVSPEFLISELNDIFGSFDEICENHGCTRIKTIGDAYMATTGLHDNFDNHADRLVQAAIEFINLLEQRNKNADQIWKCRIGINSGTVIAGIIGKSRFIYDIFGNDVNIACRIESVGEEMKVMISDKTHALLSDKYNAKSRGIYDLKGAGETELFVVDS